MASKRPAKLEIVDCKASGQLKTLKKEQAYLLKLFSRLLTKLERYLAQNKFSLLKIFTIERAYQCFFETYNNLEYNKQQQSSRDYY